MRVQLISVHTVPGFPGLHLSFGAGSGLVCCHESTGRMSMSTRFTTVVMWSILMLAGATSVGAQQFTGGVRGAVRDANGVIPGVAGKLPKEATNNTRETATTDIR